MESETVEVFRCFCAPKPMLAVFKLDEKGNPFVHILVHKQNRVIAEIVFTMGEMKVRCRNCFRWHKVRIVRGKAVHESVVNADDVPNTES
jgi:hypothetical protein